MRILLIEDEPLNVSFFRAVLEKDGHTVVHESSGILGARRALATHFDVVLCDIDLPGQDGLAVCRKLKAAGVRAKILALTVHSEESDRVRAREAGFDGFLAKPISPSALSKAVRAHAS